jgi:hypothetical protein
MIVVVCLKMQNILLRYFRDTQEIMSVSLNALKNSALSSILATNLATDMALVSTTSGKVAAHATVSRIELGYLDGVTSAIQTQLNNKQNNLTAGTGISISGNTVSTNLAAGTGISISGNTISASDLSPFKAHFVVNDNNGKLITSTTTYQFYENISGRFSNSLTTFTGTSFSYNVYNVNLTNIGISLHTNTIQNIKVGKFRIFARFTNDWGSFYHQTHDIIIHLDSSNNLIHMETFNVDYSGDSTLDISTVCDTVSNGKWYSLTRWGNSKTTFPMRIKYNSLTNVDIMFNSCNVANHAQVKLYKLIIYL